MSSPLNRYRQISAQINNRANLMVVTKNQSWCDILPIIEDGHKLFGENRVQEALKKWGKKDGRATKNHINLHLIGALQTNKVELALQVFDVIESLDREKLAETIAKAEAKMKTNCEYYIQINIGNEPQKSGINPEYAYEFIEHCRNSLKLKVTGLMCIPPADENPDGFFLKMRDIAKQSGLTKLSMGMSDDYEVAIQNGSTSVRIGSAIFKEHSEYRV